MLKFKNDVKSMGLTSFPEASQRKKSLSDHSCPILVSMMHIMSLREERKSVTETMEIDSKRIFECET